MVPIAGCLQTIRRAGIELAQGIEELRAERESRPLQIEPARENCLVAED